MDKKTTVNKGAIRLLAKGIWIKNSMHKIRITPLSEMLYSYVQNCRYEKLEEKLNFYAKILLRDSLDNDKDVDAKDVMIFDPVNDRDKLYPTLRYNDTYGKIVEV